MLLAAASEGILGVTRIPMQEESEHIQRVIGHPDAYAMPCFWHWAILLKMRLFRNRKTYRQKIEFI